MAVTPTPIFTQTPVIGMAVKITAANTAVDGTGSVSTIYTAGADGGYVRKVRCRAAGTCVQTVVRVFYNDGAGTADTNSALIADVTLPAATASNNNAIGPQVDIPLNMPIPAGGKINVCIGTAVSAGWQFSCEAGDY